METFQNTQEINTQLPEDISKISFLNIFKAFRDLEINIASVLKTVNTTCSTLLTEVDFATYEQETNQDVIPIEKDSVKYLINLKEDSVKILNNFTSFETLELHEQLNFDSIQNEIEELKSDNDNDFNKYFKGIFEGLKKLASKNRNGSIDDSSQLGYLNYTSLSSEFCLGNPVCSSPVVIPMAQIK